MPAFDLCRRLAAEAAGTLVLVATVVGSGIMAETLTHDVALVLLANALATGAILVVLITVLSPLSGAHFNPAVSLVFALRRQLAWRDAALYTVAQVLGGILGTLLAHAMFGLPLLEASTKVRTGGAQWLSEAVATFGLVAVILAGIRFRAQAVPWLVGLYITAAYWFTASTSFANPAVAIARALSDTFAGIGPIDVPGFILAELVGALLAAGALGWLLAEPRPSARTGADAALKPAGLEGVSRHLLRRTAPVTLTAAGVPMQGASQYMALSNTSVTEGVYARSAPDHMREEVAILDFTKGLQRAS